MVKKYFYLTFCLLFFSVLSAQERQKPIILVSIAPYKQIVERIVKDTADVEVIVPAGASPHVFEPTPKQTQNLSRASIWFRMGEGFENKLLPVLKYQNPNLKIIDLRQGLDLIVAKNHHHAVCTHAGCTDPHTWLSPKLMLQQAIRISDVASEVFPENQRLYKPNTEKATQELKELNSNIETLLAPLKNRTIMVSHPAYAYFCRDFNLTQLSIEFEGKDPTPSQINNILQEAKQHKIHTIFTQTQHRSKGAQLIANQINAKIVRLDPLAPDYFNNMMHIARSFAANKNMD